LVAPEVRALLQLQAHTRQSGGGVFERETHVRLGILR